jgi:hypothetical protein
MRPLILIAALFAALLFIPATADAKCCSGNRPLLRAATAPVRFVASRPVARLVAARPVRSYFANRQPVRQVLRGVGSLFVR